MTKRKLPMHSASKLDLTERCGYSGTLKTAAGRAAIMSRWVHAQGAGQTEEAAALFASLDVEEQKDVLTWSLPKSIEVAGEVMRYDECAHEVRFALDADGAPVDYDSEDRITRGIADFVWTLPELPWVLVGDLKRSSRTLAEGTRSLQLHAAGLSAAEMLGKSSYIPALWYLEEGAAELGSTVELYSHEAMTYWVRVKHAATNTDGPITGAYCDRCYGRNQCVAWFMPAHTQESWLAPLAGGNVQLTDQKATELALMLPAVEEAVKLARKQLQAYVRQGGTIESAGKVYAPVITKGRESLDKRALEEALGDLTPYTRRGPDFDTWRWIKRK